MPKLLGVIKFVYDETKTRTLNATQAYDTQSSGITLGSFAATAEMKSSLNKNKGDGLIAGGIVQTNLNLPADLVIARTQQNNPHAASVWFTNDLQLVDQGIKASRNVGCSQGDNLFGCKSILQFNGSGTSADAPQVPRNSTASNSTTFYGAITVATTRYKSWQGKYAVLTINNVTKKAKLRVFDE